MSLKYDFFLKEKVADSELIERFLKEQNVPHSTKINDNQIYFDVYEKLGFEIYTFIERKYKLYDNWFVIESKLNQKALITN